MVRRGEATHGMAGKPRQRKAGQRRARRNTVRRGTDRQGRQRFNEAHMSTEIKTILESLFNQNGMLLPEQVVEFATPADSPLHSYFEWDDTEAARKFRVDQARTLIRSVTITHEKSKDVQVRAYVSLPSDRIHGAGYRRMSEVLSNEFLRAQLAEEMMRQASLWEQRAQLIGISLNVNPIVRQARRIANTKPQKKAA